MEANALQLLAVLGPAGVGLVFWLFKSSLARNLESLDKSFEKLTKQISELESRQNAQTERLLMAISRNEMQLAVALTDIGSLKARSDKQEERMDGLAAYWRDKMEGFGRRIEEITRK